MNNVFITSKYKLAYWAIRRGHYIDAAMQLLPYTKLGDSIFAVVSHYRKFRRIPNWRNPKTGNEHLLRLKLSGELASDLRIKLSDKELTKFFVQERVGNGYTPVTYFVLKTKAEVRNVPFPEKCIVKPTHSSGQYLVIKSASQHIDREEISSWLDINYYTYHRESNYRFLEPKIIVEELLSGTNGDLPNDYKFFCFQGKPKLIAVNSDRSVGMCLNYYSPNWRELDISRSDYPRYPLTIEKPVNLNEMLEIAAKLSAGFSFIRVDFYQLDNRISIGEITNLPDGAEIMFFSEDMDERFGVLFDNPSADAEDLFGLQPVES